MNLWPYEVQISYVWYCMQCHLLHLLFSMIYMINCVGVLIQSLNEWSISIDICQCGRAASHQITAKERCLYGDMISCGYIPQHCVLEARYLHRAYYTYLIHEITLESVQLYWHNSLFNGECVSWWGGAAARLDASPRPSQSIMPGRGWFIYYF